MRKPMITDINGGGLTATGEETRAARAALERLAARIARRSVRYGRLRSRRRAGGEDDDASLPEAA